MKKLIPLFVAPALAVLALLGSPLLGTSSQARAALAANHTHVLGPYTHHHAQHVAHYWRSYGWHAHVFRHQHHWYVQVWHRHHGV
jgi:hypothetical protein